MPIGRAPRTGRVVMMRRNPYRVRYGEYRKSGKRRGLIYPTKVYKQIGYQPYVFKRTYPIGNVAGLSFASSNNGSSINKSANGFYIDTGNAGTGNMTYHAYSLYFTLNQLPSYNEFTTLFDKYKICGVKWKLVPFNTTTLQETTALGTQANQQLSVIHSSVVDKDDATVPPASDAGLQDLRQYNTYKSMNAFRGTFKKYIVPAQATAVYNGAFTAYAPKYGYVDMGNPGVQHYGLKGIIQVFCPDASAHHYVWFRSEATVFFKCKDLR